SVAVESGPFTACGSEKLIVNRIVDDTDDDLVATGEGDGNAEAGVAVCEIGGAVERINVPAVFGVVVFAQAFFGGNSVRWEIFAEALDDGLFAAFVSLRNEVDVAFVFDFGRAREFFAQDFAGFPSGFEGGVKKSVEHGLFQFNIRKCLWNIGANASITVTSRNIHFPTTRIRNGRKKQKREVSGSA